MLSGSTHGQLGVVYEEKSRIVDSASQPQALPAPHSQHSTSSRVVKGEDVIYIHPLAIATAPQSMLYMICDGHSGVEAANFVAANFVRILNSRLPPRPPPIHSAKDMEDFAATVRQAVVETFVSLDNDWITVGHMAGTTVTAALVIGYLLTVANVGDSAAVLDTGCSILELTGSHRIHTNTEEQARLRGANCQLAPLGFHLQGPARTGELGVGPLRLWPGGLCVSRSVGDLDAGSEVVPIPHIKQVVLPQAGARIILCSDGVWDLMSLSKAVKLTRMKPCSPATASLMQTVSRDLRMLDDASIVMVDFLPCDSTSFPTIALKANPQSEKSSGGLFACFRPELDEPDSRDAQGVGHLSFLADLDALKEYPGERTRLLRSNVQHVATAIADAQLRASAPPDYTMHGSNKVQFYRGYGEGSRFSATAVADVAVDVNHSMHSVQSCDSPSTKSLPFTHNDGDYAESPVVAFGSAPRGAPPLHEV